MKFSGKTQLFLFNFETYYWIIILVTMTMPISSHVKDKNSVCTAHGEDIIFGKRRTPGISSISIYFMGILQWYSTVFTFWTILQPELC